MRVSKKNVELRQRSQAVGQWQPFHAAEAPERRQAETAATRICRELVQLWDFPLGTHHSRVGGRVLGVRLGRPGDVHLLNPAEKF